MKLINTSLTLALVASVATGQWSDDAANNLAVSNAAADQVQPMIAPTADGGCYISWLDSIANGFDVRLQRLDVNGNELWPHDGVLVIDRSFSSTQSYGLDIDAAGNALVTARDDSGSGVQISAAQVTPAGSIAWSVMLTNTSAFVASPKIAGTSGGAVIAWTQDSAVKVQKLDASGAPLWGAGLTLSPSVGAYLVGDLHDSGSDVILSMVHQTGAMFWSPKHLVAQKFDAAGSALWGAAPMSVFDSGSLQIGNYPPFTTDGSGGAVFAWYGTSPLQCYAQHVLSNGVEAFPHNGVAGSTNSAQVRVNPSASYDAASGSTFLFWTEQNTGQSQCGLSGQRFDSAGNRQWTAHGTSLIPVSSPEIRQVKTLVSGAGAFVFWTHIPSFGNDTMHGAHVDGAGAYDIGPFDVASTSSVKSRLAARAGTSGQMILAWSDQRTDGGDILAQNINSDGSLGAGAGALGASYCYGVSCPCGNNDPSAGCANYTGAGASLSASGSASISADDLILEASGLTSGPGLYFQGDNAINGGNGTSFGDGMRCAGGSIVRLQVRFSSGGASQTTLSISTKGGVSAGQLKRYQYWYRDTDGSPCGSNFNLSTGLELAWEA